MNYGEEIVFWYLRFNGFFPISNFVVHQGKSSKPRTEIDLLAIRPPFVEEEIGGSATDWDDYLSECLHFGRSVQSGIICEVKTGQDRFRSGDIFTEQKLEAAINRLGVFNNAVVSQALGRLKDSPSFESDQGPIVAKLLVSNHKDDGNRHQCLHRSIEEIEDFIIGRVQKYKREKFKSRMFFQSSMLQLLLAREKRN